MEVMERKKLILAIIYTLRPTQWIKNLAVFASVIFAGEFFNPTAFLSALGAFIVFCILSSASYVLNDVIDAPHDRRHPVKKNRPIAKGDLPISLAFNLSFLIFFFGLLLAFWLGVPLLIMALLFVLIHIFYSLFLKRVAVWDILAISASFIIRTLAGEAATGYHLPVWLMFTVIFLSLFVASGKRRSELVVEGRKARPALLHYRKALLDFYFSIFAVSTLISYSLFTYLAGPQSLTPYFTSVFASDWLRLVSGRKWLMITILPVIFGIMRYAQLVLYRKEGERPEKLVTSDLPLLLSILTWGLMVIFVIYVV
jgi:4-hydroxybenzoate polyprenyltransferase